MVEANYCIEKGYPHDAQVIYGDTDSVMVKFGVDDVAEAMRLGQETAEMVSATFTKPIKLEFEKVYCPYLLMNKKRYAGLYWTNPHNYDKLDAKGIETVRRDNCGLVRQLVDISLRTILIDKSVPKAVEFVQKAVSDLLQNKIDLSLLVITKSLGRERMRKRDPSTAPGSGDRVPYVIVTGSKGAKAYERSEDPLYALENNKSVDAQYYIEHQLQLPLLRIFGPIMGDDKKAQSLLFCGQHTRKLHTPTPQGGALAKFVTKSLRCMGCKAVIKAGLLCEHCEKEKAADVVIEQMENFRQKEEEFSRLFSIAVPRLERTCSWHRSSLLDSSWIGERTLLDVFRGNMLMLAGEHGAALREPEDVGRSCTDAFWILPFLGCFGFLIWAYYYAVDHGNLLELTGLPNGNGLICGVSEPVAWPPGKSRAAH
eukprot:g17899.t1